MTEADHWIRGSGSRGEIEGKCHEGYLKGDRNVLYIGYSAGYKDM